MGYYFTGGFIAYILASLAQIFLTIVPIFIPIVVLSLAVVDLYYSLIVPISLLIKASSVNVIVLSSRKEDYLNLIKNCDEKM